MKEGNNQVIRIKLSPCFPSWITCGNTKIRIWEPFEDFDEYDSCSLKRRIEMTQLFRILVWRRHCDGRNKSQRWRWWAPKRFKLMEFSFWNKKMNRLKCTNNFLKENWNYIFRKKPLEPLRLKIRWITEKHPQRHELTLIIQIKRISIWLFNKIQILYNHVS